VARWSQDATDEPRECLPARRLRCRMGRSADWGPRPRCTPAESNAARVDRGSNHMVARLDTKHGCISAGEGVVEFFGSNRWVSAKPVAASASVTSNFILTLRIGPVISERLRPNCWPGARFVSVADHLSRRLTGVGGIYIIARRIATRKSAQTVVDEIGSGSVWQLTSWTTTGIERSDAADACACAIHRH